MKQQKFDITVLINALSKHDADGDGKNPCMICNMCSFILLVYSVNGGFSAWSGWTKCSVSCAGGRRSRSRSCTKPTPSNGGRNCSELGNNTEEVDCGTDLCPGMNY